jgi:hypothetical protein
VGFDSLLEEGVEAQVVAMLTELRQCIEEFDRRWAVFEKVLATLMS